MDAHPARFYPSAAMLVEGRHVARIMCRRCGRVVEADPAVLRGLRGPPLFRALRCTKCGARKADVSIRWEQIENAVP